MQYKVGVLTSPLSKAGIPAVSNQITEAAIHIRKDMPGFEETGLKVDSVIRLDKIATVLKDLVIAELGELDTHSLLKIYYGQNGRKPYLVEYTVK